MTPEQLRAAGRALYGDGLAYALHLAPGTLRRMLDGREPIGEPLRRELDRLLTAAGRRRIGPPILTHLVVNSPSALIGERVKAGMARAKAQGKRTSRPPIPETTRRKIAELHAQGVSVKRIAKELGIAYGTAWNYAKGASGRPI
jgi:hypothetical protein